jgi:hypothetical protein
LFSILVWLIGTQTNHDNRFVLFVARVFWTRLGQPQEYFQDEVPTDGERLKVRGTAKPEFRFRGFCCDAADN